MLSMVEVPVFMIALVSFLIGLCVGLMANKMTGE